MCVLSLYRLPSRERPGTLGAQRTDTPSDEHREASKMINIAVSSRSLAAARSVDPDVSPAAVHAAVEAAIEEQLRQLGRRRDHDSESARRER
jgi:post-segregation antitoxin (ccd killing protein)